MVNVAGACDVGVEQRKSSHRSWEARSFFEESFIEFDEISNREAMKIKVRIFIFVSFFNCLLIFNEEF